MPSTEGNGWRVRHARLLFLVGVATGIPMRYRRLPAQTSAYNAHECCFGHLNTVGSLTRTCCLSFRAVHPLLPIVEMVCTFEECDRGVPNSMLVARRVVVGWTVLSTLARQRTTRVIVTCAETFRHTSFPRQSNSRKVLQQGHCG